MKSLAASLTAHQKLKNGRKPAISAVAYPERGGLPILNWTQWYSGSETDQPAAACVSSAGTLHRVRNNGATILHSRVTSPTSGSTYSTWGTTLGTDGVTNKGVAIAAYGTTLIACWVKTGSKRIRYRTSSDDGVTWAAAADMVAADETGTVDWVSVALKSATAGSVFYNNSAVLRRCPYSASAFGTRADSTLTYATISGIASWWDSTSSMYFLTICGTASGATAYYQVSPIRWNESTWNDSTWKPFRVDPAASIGVLRQPSVVAVPTGAAVALVMTWCERDTAALSYTRTFISRGTPGQTTLDGFWYTEPEPFNVTQAYGGVLTYQGGSATQWFMVTSSQVWSATAPAAPGTGTTLDNRVISCRLRLGSAQATGELVLDDDSGAYVAGTYTGLLTGGEVHIKAGYGSGTGAAAEYGTGWRLRVTALRHRLTRTGRRELHVQLAGPWETGRAVRARQSWTFPATANPADIIRYALGRIGGWDPRTASASADTTSTFTQGVTVAALDDWTHIHDRSLGRSPDVAVLDGQQVQVKAVTSSDATTYTYGNGATDHPLYELETVDEVMPANWYRVQGYDRYTDEHDYASIQLHGPRLGPLLLELDADSNAKVTSYGQHQVTHARMREHVATATVPWNAGQEPCDVVTVNDPLLGGADFTARIQQLELRYDRSSTPPRYDAILTLVRV